MIIVGKNWKLTDIHRPPTKIRFVQQRQGLHGLFVLVACPGSLSVGGGEVGGVGEGEQSSFVQFMLTALCLLRCGGVWLVEGRGTAWKKWTRVGKNDHWCYGRQQQQQYHHLTRRPVHRFSRTIPLSHRVPHSRVRPPPAHVICQPYSQQTLFSPTS